jgi:hypothetical protein
MNAPDPADTLGGQPEWDEPTAEWVTSLWHDPPPTPTTISEALVLVPAYTQTAWERRMVAWIQNGEDCESYLWHNLHKTDETLIYDLLLMLGFDRAAHEHMTRCGAVTGAVYGSMTAPAAGPARAANGRFTTRETS